MCTWNIWSLWPLVSIGKTAQPPAFLHKTRFAKPTTAHKIPKLLPSTLLCIKSWTASNHFICNTRGYLQRFFIFLVESRSICWTPFIRVRSWNVFWTLFYLSNHELFAEYHLVHRHGRYALPPPLCEIEKYWQNALLPVVALTSYSFLCDLYRAPLF